MKKRLIDEANWRGVEWRSINVGTRNKPAKWRHNGYQYCTAGEYRLAVLLEKQGIPFTPDIAFPLNAFGGNPFVVDFVLDGRAYVWTGGGKARLLHCIEAKGTINVGGRLRGQGGVFKPKALENVEALREERGVHTLLLSNASIRVYYARGKLPLVPLDEWQRAA